MRPVKIITDSTADLSKDLLEKLDVVSIPLNVTFGEETFKDGVDINSDQLYEMVNERNELPKTAAISPGVFHLEFKKWIDQGYDIVYIGIGSKISATYQNAFLSSQEFENNRIFLIDSLNLSSGIGLLVLKATDFKKQNLNAKEIQEKLVDIVPRVRSQFAIKVLDYLHKGGRASGTAALLGKVLRIRPIIKVNNGQLDVYKKPMGTMKKAIDIMLEDYYNEKDNIDLDYVMITHSQANSNADYMLADVTEKLKPNNLVLSNAGCVISSHCGAGTIGILYIVKS